MSIRFILLISFLLLSVNAEEKKEMKEMKKDNETVNHNDKGFKDKWAAIIKEKKGLTNFRKVNSTLYRGAQPTAEGMKTLKAMGVKTILNLRSFHSDRDEIGSTKLNYAHLYTKTWHVEEKEIISFLKLVNNKEKTPVFVHCMQDVDRTGTICAVYRIVMEDWSKEEAIAEMKAIGHNTIWKNLPSMLRKLNVEKIKKDVGIK